MDFVNWVEDELKNRDWSRADLARNGKLTTAQVTRVLNRQQGPGQAFCKGIAKAFNLPIEQVFRNADILPPNEPPDPWAEEMAALVNSLQNPLYREAAQILIEGYVKKEEKERRKAK